MNKKHMMITAAVVTTSLQSLYSMDGHPAPARAPRRAPRCTIRYTINQVVVPAFVGACCGIAGGPEGNPNDVDTFATLGGTSATFFPLCCLRTADHPYHKALPGASFIAAYAATKSLKSMLFFSSEN